MVLYTMSLDYNDAITSFYESLAAELSAIAIHKIQEVFRDPLDGDETHYIADLFLTEFDYAMGNITSDEYDIIIKHIKERYDGHAI
jgi:hypothetical protein